MMKHRTFWACAAVGALTACATPPPPSDRTAIPPKGSLAPPGLAKRPVKSPSRIATVLTPSKVGGKPARPVPKTVTLPTAYQLILQRNPDLAQSYLGIRIEEAKILQAGLIPNPEIEVELGEFGGTRDRRGLRSSEVSVVFSQVIETGGKRARRVEVARRRKHVASWDYLIKRADLFKSAADALIDVVANQQVLGVRASDLALSRRLLQIASARVNAGQLSPVELDKARVRLSTSQIEYRRARTALTVSRARLAAFWGAQKPSFRRATLAGIGRYRLASMGQYLKAAGRNPELSKVSAEILLARGVLRLEKARTVPNVTLGAGTTRFIESRENALIVKFSVPLPIFGINPGEIQAARFGLRRSRLDRRSLALKLATDIRTTYRRIRSIGGDLGTLRGTALPSARRAVAAAVAGFQEGKFDFLAVLDAQRTLLDIRLRRAQAQREYWKARVALARLVGMTILQSPRIPKRKVR